MFKKIILYTLLLTSISSCEKEIILPLDKNQSMLVIDGVVTDEVGPYYVKLSKSLAFTDASLFPGVTNATVIIKDNFGSIDTLKHTTQGVYLTNTIKGMPGNTYILDISVDGKKYSAQSTMPQKVILDSLRINTFNINGTIRYSIIPLYNDPISFGNSYRFIQKINDTLDKTFHVFNDNLNNGKVNQRPLGGGTDSLEVKFNDFVAIEMQCITRQTYLYYYALNQQSGAGPGGGTTPSNPPSNIIGGALGLFSAHTVQRRGITIK